MWPEKERAHEQRLLSGKGTQLSIKNKTLQIPPQFAKNDLKRKVPQRKGENKGESVCALTESMPRLRRRLEPL